MSEIIRSRFFSFCISDTTSPNVDALLRGKVVLETASGVVGVSGSAAGQQFPVDSSDLDLLGAISSDVWEAEDAVVQRLNVDRSRIRALARQGFLLSTSDDPRLTAYRERELSLREAGWARTSAAQHFASRLQMKGSGRAESPFATDPAERRAAYEAYVDRNGPPPPTFLQTAGARIDLTRSERADGLWRFLRSRSTSRTFDQQRELGLKTFSELLETTFGCLETAHLATGVEVARRTSPSGGGMHPIEAFPVLLRVEHAEPAWYHYDMVGHALVRQRQLGKRSEAAQEMVRLCAGQSWAGEANALVFLIARYDRSFWKYRDNERAGSVVLMDAGHLSQTFYLTAAALGLGVFFSAAVDVDGIDTLLGLDGVRCGTLGVLGCGWRLAEDPMALWPAAADDR